MEVSALDRQASGHPALAGGRRGGQAPGHDADEGADFTEDLFERAQALLAAIELCPNRGDLRLKLGATYVNLQAWPEALEQLRVADYLVPAEEHELVVKLAETADKAYQARFLPPDVPDSAATAR